MDLIWTRRAEVSDADVVKNQARAGVIVGWFALTQADKMLDPIVQQIPVVGSRLRTRHPS